MEGDDGGEEEKLNEGKSWKVQIKLVAISFFLLWLFRVGLRQQFDGSRRQGDQVYNYLKLNTSKAEGKLFVTLTSSIDYRCTRLVCSH